ncbi:hypothetical protein C7212DRAFT_362553 [Tuber magnatum]|uniref:Uncharacterized protein n=1 Tax=Tuber magnatum TaxID=42249 RepID=A0A317STL6_9PEZI|nr:hypothetical protein C7212DRAFT_362553 [Tuber magnatum]
MALWPFRKRRKTKVAEGKKVAAPDPPLVERKMFLARKNSSRQKPRRAGSHRNPKDGSYSANNRVNVPEFPQPPNNSSSSPIPIQNSFHPQKQPHEGGFSSYFIEPNNSMSASSASSHRPHKPTSIARKLSKRGRDRSQQPQPPPSAYITQLARTASKRDKKRIRNFDELEDDRPMSRSSLPARDSTNSSLSSQSSMRAYKVRNIFTPRPKLHYENSTGTSPTKSARLHPLTPSRSNSRSLRDGRHTRAGITDEELLRGGRVDELADELDVHGIKEALDRDRRRRERKKKEDHEKLQRKLERRAAKQREQERMDREMGFEMDDDHFQRNLYNGPNYGAPEYQTGESSRSAGRAGFMITPEPYPFPDPDDRPRDGLSPFSWLHNPSQEKINAHSAQRVDMVTPVSMDSNQGMIGEPEYRGPEQTDSYRSTGPLAQPHEPSHTGGIHNVGDCPSTFRGAFAVDDDDIGRDGLDAGIDTGRGKVSGWTSFLKKATTAARMRKEQSTRGIRSGESVLISDSEGEETHERELVQGNEFYEVDNLRKNQGQTPGTHIPDEVAFAMTALETGHVRGKDSMEAEKRGSFTPGRPLLPYSLHGRPSSSKSSLTGLPHRTPTSNPRSYLGSLDYGSDSPTLPIQPIRTSSTNSQNHYGRPSPTQRYSPSMHRHSLEAVGPDGRPRSLMSTSLASIDSEGSWLSGRVANPRGSINHISPLRTSATSLRRRYQEFDDNGSTNGDDYFSGVTPRRKRREGGGDEEMNGATRLDLSDVEDSDEEGSVGSEAEKKMWRDGPGKKVVAHKVPTTSGSPVDPKTAVLNTAQASTIGTAVTTAPSKDDQQSTTTTRQSWDPTSEVEVFATPMEHPYAPTYNNLEFKTPMEHPAARQSSYAEFVAR